MKKVFAVGVCVLLVALVAMAVVLFSQAVNEPDELSVVLENGASEADTFEITGILPGETHTRTYAVESRTGTLTITLDTDGGALAGMLTAELSADGEVLYTGLLAEADGQTFVCATDGETEIEVKFTLPLDTGNEAQRAETNVTVTFVAENEWD